MTFKTSFSKSLRGKSDTAAVFVYAGNKLSEPAVALNKKAGGLISHALKNHGAFKGKTGQFLSLALPESAGFSQAILIGLGDPEKLDGSGLETLGGKFFPFLKSSGAIHLSILGDAKKGFGKTGTAEALARLVFGLGLRSYSFEKYKLKNKEEIAATSLKIVDVITTAATKAESFYREYDAVLQGVFLARDVVNEPPNILYPETYAQRIRKELQPLGVTVDVLDEKKLEKLGAGAILAVGMGSARPPRMVIMRWNGAKNKKSRGKGPLAFVGKGVTFDTGGISIKPAHDMDEMKMDMGGSAAVIGLMKALALRKAKIDVIGAVGLAENMPSDRAYRPGDILTSLSGKTIEVLNTDAEGRLVLIDVLTYVQKYYKPSVIIDLATLTGAMMVALGFEYCGGFVNDEILWKQLEKASKRAGEKLWRMPLDEAYRKEMDSHIADLKNLGSLGRYGGACSAAGFLERFIENKTPWAHLDIAGTAWLKSDRPTTPKGGTGYGVRLLHDFVTENYEA